MLDAIRKRAAYVPPISIAILVMFVLLDVLPVVLGRVAPSLVGYSALLAWGLADLMGIILYVAGFQRTSRARRPAQTHVHQLVTG
jgi:hypothetical protein